MKLIQHSDKIWSIENFLTKEECNLLILFSEQKGYEEATVSLTSGAKMMKNIRNNYRFIYTDHDLAKEYWSRLQKFCPEYIEDNEAVGLNEQFRFYKYEPSQRFKRHIDGRFTRNESEESRVTFLIYLNDDFEGGQTKFDDLVIQPKVGTALCFIHELKHEGVSVTDGEKYVLRSDVMYQKK
ncbi:MAG: oxidoreductase, 2OG-Fe(II) oxygenase [Cytophagales bacterium]|nr:oxidoreductase, 2OG-Fe(II) oxygenase [Cytophagales bacterium]